MPSRAKRSPLSPSPPPANERLPALLRRASGEMAAAPGGQLTTAWSSPASRWKRFRPPERAGAGRPGRVLDFLAGAANGWRA